MTGVVWSQERVESCSNEMSKGSEVLGGRWNMKWSRALAVLLLVLTTVVIGTLARAETIQPGAVRWVTGKVTAVDMVHRTVVIEVPRGSKMLTVGVTMEDSATLVGIKRFVDLKEGMRVSLKYTRTDDRLIGKELWVRK